MLQHIVGGGEAGLHLKQCVGCKAVRYGTAERTASGRAGGRCTGRSASKVVAPETQELIPQDVRVLRCAAVLSGATPGGRCRRCGHLREGCNFEVVAGSLYGNLMVALSWYLLAGPLPDGIFRDP